MGLVEILARLPYSAPATLVSTVRVPTHVAIFKSLERDRGTIFTGRCCFDMMTNVKAGVHSRA